MRTSSTASRAWHAALATIAGVALVWQAVLVVRSGDGLVDLFAYFTIQSNLIVAVAAGAIALGRPWHGRAWRAFRLAGLVGITVTGVVYVVAIGPYVQFEGIVRVLDSVFHYVVPAAAVLGHVLFRPREEFERSDLVFLAWPVLWLAGTLARGRWGSPSFTTQDGLAAYPYAFLDIERQGATSVAVAAVVVTLLLTAVALVYIRSGRSVAR